MKFVIKKLLSKSNKEYLVLCYDLKWKCSVLSYDNLVIQDFLRLYGEAYYNFCNNMKVGDVFVIEKV